MGNWVDLVSLILVVVFFVAVVAGAVYAVNMISEGVKNAKEGLKTKGVHITDSGVTVKTSKRVDRENYLDRTQAAIVNSMKYTSAGNTDEARNSPTNDSKEEFLSPGHERPGFKLRRSTSGNSGAQKRK